MYRVGYVDEEEGPKNTFYQSLKDEFEVVLFDITEETTEDIIISWIFDQKLDMVVFDFLLDESGLVDFNADKVVDKLKEKNLYYPVFVFTSNEMDALNHMADVNLVNGKEMEPVLLRKKVMRVITDYYDKIEKEEETLRYLEPIRSTQNGLTPDQEDKYVSANNFLDKITNSKEHISRTFYSEGTNKRLDSLILRTEELLAKLPEEGKEEEE